MQTASQDLLDVDPFSLLADEPAPTKVRSGGARKRTARQMMTGK